MAEPVVTIREAVPGDAPVLARLRLAFRSTTNAVTEDEAAFVARCAAWMAARLAEGAPWRCWVAESPDGDVVGAIWLQRIEKIPNPSGIPEEHGYVSNFYVDPAHRARGVGDALLRTVLAWCDARPVHSTILWPTARSRPLYARHGFGAADDVMERPTPSGA